MNSKQRAYLRSLAMTMDPIFQIGKASLTPEIITALDEALEKRELIKVAVLKNCADDPREIAEVIAERTRSVVVKVIGKKIILFRQAKKNSKYDLPKQVKEAIKWQKKTKKSLTNHKFLAIMLIATEHMFVKWR